MPVVTEDIDLPAGAQPTGVTVELFLAGTDGDPLPAGYASAADKTIAGHYKFNLDAAGGWSQTLTANSLITPSGTVWAIRLSGPTGAQISKVARFFSVTNGAGPYVLQNLLTDPPGTLTPAQTQVALNAFEAANSVTVGKASIVAGGLVIDVTTPWGIAAGVPYYDPGAVTAGQEAFFHIEPDATASWVLVSEVH